MLKISKNTRELEEKPIFQEPPAETQMGLPICTGRTKNHRIQEGITWETIEALMRFWQILTTSFGKSCCYALLFSVGGLLLVLTLSLLLAFD